MSTAVLDADGPLSFNVVDASRDDNKGTGTILSKSDAANTRVEIERVRLDTLLNAHYPGSEWWAMDRCRGRRLRRAQRHRQRVRCIVFFEIEVEEHEIWQRQAIKSDVSALAHESGLTMVARGAGDVQYELCSSTRRSSTPIDAASHLGDRS